MEENLNLFKTKCARLDMPPECYPQNEYLRKIFRQNLSFFELFLQKVDTKHAVDAIRKNILIGNMTNSVRENKSADGPKEFRNFLKYQSLLSKVKDFEGKKKFLEQEQLQKLETLEKNEIKRIKSKESLRLSKAKSDILEAKLIGINRDIEKEEALQKRIKEITPAKFSSSDSIDDFSNSIRDTIQILQEFASIEKADENVRVKDTFWKRIESQIKRVPNNVLFQMILKRLESKIEDSVLSSNAKIQKVLPVKVSEKLLPFLYRDKIIAGIELQSQKKRLEASKKVYAENIQVFENEIEGLLNASIDCSFQLEEDDIVGEFLSVVIAKVNLEGKIQFCTDIIKEMKGKIESNTAVLEYESLVNDTRSIYNFTDEKVTAVQENVAQIHQINEKINFSKISVMRLIQSLKIEKSQQYNRALLNQTLNNTVINNKENEASLPKHEMEIQQFLDTPILSFDTSTKLGRLLAHNDEIISNIIHITGHFYHPQQFLEVLQRRINFGTQIKALSNEVAPSKEQIAIVNYDDLQKQRFENSEEISAMFDEISKMNVAIQSNLRKTHLLVHFAFENPLRKFVPKTKKFEGKSYDSYEKEYMLYYKMIKN